MSNSTLDPKLYEAVRTGNTVSFITHANLNPAELAAFNANPDDAKATDVTNHVNSEETESLYFDAVIEIADDVNPTESAAIHVEDVTDVADDVNPTESAALNFKEAIDVRNGVPLQPASPLSGVTWAGDTVLHIAICFRQTLLAKKICQVSTSFLTRANKKGETPLHYAAQAGNHGLVKYFIGLARQGGSNIDLVELLRRTNQDTETALYQAVHHQHHKVLEELIMHEGIHQASIPGNKQIISPLYLATMLRSLPIVTCLVDLLPRNVSRAAYAGPEGQTALHDAALSRNTSFVEMFLEWKPELAKAIDNSGYTPLHYAALRNNHAVANLLLEKDRTSAYEADSSGLYPVHVAAKLGHLQVVIELFNQCPDSGELVDRQGRNFLHLAVKEKRVGIVKWVCKKIIEFEKAISAQDNEGNTPLHLAVKTRDPTVVCHLLLCRRAALNWVNENELTPLDIAYEQAKNGSSDIQKPDYVIYRILYEIGCSLHKYSRTVHLELEDDQQQDEKKEQKETESYESMAKNLSVGSVLIASAAFAAAFTVYGLYINKKDLNDNLHGKLSFQIFFILDAFAFFCSIIATGLLVEVASTSLPLGYRKRYFLLCTVLVMIAAKCFIMAFAAAAYLILNPVRRWLAITVYVMGAIASILILSRPHYASNLLVSRTIIRYRWQKLFRIFGMSQWYPLVNTLSYLFVLYYILSASIHPGWKSNSHRNKTTWSDLILALMICHLGNLFFLFYISEPVPRLPNARRF